VISDPYSAVLERLATAEVPIEILEHDPVFTMEDVKQTIAIPTHAQVKSMVVVSKDGDIAICGIHPVARLSVGAVARELGVARSRLSLASPQVVVDILGVPPGAVGLVAPIPVRTLLHDTFEAESQLYFGAGRHDRTIKAPTALLARALDIRFARIEADL